ncbi:hypothetical protein B0H11DRAFT_2112701 [Mycena galericulata]|nr:hypothetical protein B0H11DRAFT_2112701 [Mycena galericulata]
MPAGSAPVKDAPEPFSGAPDPHDTNPPSDFILRSSDNVDFHVHKQILAFVSVFFSNMFTFPSGEAPPTEIERDGKPVLILPEAANVIHRLLCIAYPARSRQHYSFAPEDLDSVCDVHEAAQKYQFMHAQAVITEMLTEPVLLDGQPHRLFAIAQLRNIRELAEQAALCTLKHPVAPESLSFPEMRLLTWEQAQKLYDFHRLCGREAKRIVAATAESTESYSVGPNRNPNLLCHDEDNNMFSWWDDESYYGHDAKCGPISKELDLEFHGRLTFIEPAPWFQARITRLASEVFLLPTGGTAETPYISPQERAMIDGCEYCSGCAEKELAKFGKQLARSIDVSNMMLAKRAGVLGL